MATAPYDTAFFLQHRSPGLRSAEAVVPFLLSCLRCRSVLDVGCGDGAWLSVFRANGVEDTVWSSRSAWSPRAFNGGKGAPRNKSGESRIRQYAVGHGL